MKSVIRVTNYFINGKFKRLGRFSIIGLLNTLIDFTFFTIFNGLFEVNYALSQVIGYSFGVINSFIFNRKWTFQSGNIYKDVSHELIQFIVVNVISLSVSIIFIKFLVNDFSANVYVAKVIATFIAQATNFLAYKLWVFN